MKIVRYETPGAFLEDAEPFLLRDEASHNLLLGIPARLAARGPDAWRGAYLATAVEREETVAAAMITPPWRLVLSQTDSEDALRRIAEHVVESGVSPPGVTAPEPVCDVFIKCWHDLTGQAVRRLTRERIHRLDRVQPTGRVPGELRDATEADRPLLMDWLRAFAEEAFAPDNRPPGGPEQWINRPRTRHEGFALWSDGVPRSVSGFGSPTQRGIRIGPVYTPPEHRSRGYGTACVAELSRRLLAGGRGFCMLYTDLANPTSNRIYRRIGYEPVCDVAEYRIEGR